MRKKLLTFSGLYRRIQSHKSHKYSFSGRNKHVNIHLPYLFYFKIHMEKYSYQYWALCSFVVTVLLCHCLSDCQPSKCVFDAGRSGPVGNHCMIKYWRYCTYSYMYCTYSCLEFFLVIISASNLLYIYNHTVWVFAPLIIYFLLSPF